MNSKNAIFINATLDDNIHEVIDSSLIIQLRQIGLKVDIFLLKRRCNIVKQDIESYLGENDLSFHDLCSLKKRSGIKDLIAAIIECWIFMTKGTKETLYLFSFINMFSCHLINFLSKLTGKKVLICCHSELEIVSHPSPSIKKYWDFLVQRFFLKSVWANNLYLIVLGDNIKKNLIPYMAQQRLDKIISIDHPYFSLNKSFETYRVKSDEIKIGVIGGITSSPTRGFNNLQKFANKIYGNCFVKIYLISRISPDLRERLPENVVFLNTNNSYLPKKEYDRLVRDMDYIYIPYPKECFKLTASGAVLEAIFQNKPILMHGNDYFAYLSAKYGRFGLVVDDLNCMDLLKIFQNDEFYSQLCLSQRQMMDALDPIKLSCQLERNIKLIFGSDFI